MILVPKTLKKSSYTEIFQRTNNFFKLAQGTHGHATGDAEVFHHQCPVYDDASGTIKNSATFCDSFPNVFFSTGYTVHCLLT